MDLLHDTLPMLKIRYQNGMKSYKQETLVESLLDVTYNAHNAEKKQCRASPKTCFWKGKCGHSGIR